MSEDLIGRYDIVVIGGGPVGLATAYECAKAGQKVLVLEQSVFYNQSGSSGDIVRMFRTAYTEDYMATLAVQSMEVWDELEMAAGEPLRLMTGLLNFGDPNYGAGGPEGTLTGPIPNLEAHHMKYTMLNRDQIEQNFPFQRLPDTWEGIDMPENGCINVPLLLRTLHRLCKQLGVHLFDYATVKKIIPDPSRLSTWMVEGVKTNSHGVSVMARQFRFCTKKIALTPGAYVNHVLYPSFGISLDVNIWEMVYEYYAVDPDIAFPKMWFQFQEDTVLPNGTHVSNLFYGFPAVPWGTPNLCRIAVDTATNVIADPNERQYPVISPDDLENTRTWLADHVLGVGPNPLAIFAGTCLQTNVADNMFVLDYVPNSYLHRAHQREGDSLPVPTDAAPRGEVDKSVVLFTAGWAMKFVPLLGRILKELLVDGATEYDISHFDIHRKVDGVPIIRDGPLTAKNLRTRNVGSSLHRRVHH